MPTSQGPVRVVVVDDEDDVRRLIKVNLSVDRRFEVVGDFSTGEEAMAHCGELLPDLVVLDLMMPGVNGAQVLQQIKADSPQTKIAMFTAATVGVAASLTGDEAHLYVQKTEVLLDVIDRLHDLVRGDVAAPLPPPPGPVVRLPPD